jgi:hypothetical protein
MLRFIAGASARRGKGWPVSETILGTAQPVDDALRRDDPAAGPLCKFAGIGRDLVDAFGAAGEDSMLRQVLSLWRSFMSRGCSRSMKTTRRPHTMA